MKDQFVITLLLFGGSMKRNSPLSLFPLSLDSYRSAAKITLTHFGAVAATRQLHRNNASTNHWGHCWTDCWYRNWPTTTWTFAFYFINLWIILFRTHVHANFALSFWLTRSPWNKFEYRFRRRPILLVTNSELSAGTTCTRLATRSLTNKPHRPSSQAMWRWRRRWCMLGVVGAVA